MTPTTIILIVIILLLVYILYSYLTGTVTSLTPAASLKSHVPAITKIDGARNSRYGYSIWIYVNTWSNSGKKTIFSRANNMKLYLDETSPSLKLDMAMNGTGDYGKDTMTITTNFPLQKWVCIAISVDNQFVDAYLDGKLVKSQRLFKQQTIAGVGSAPATVTSYIPRTPPDATLSPINLGNLGETDGFTEFDAFIAEFKRWSIPIDPQSAWDTYLAGNGTNAISRAFSSYGIDIAVLKNNVEQTKFSF